MLSAAGAGTFVAALAAGSRRIRHRGRIVLGSYFLIGVLLIVLAYAPTVLWASVIIAAISCAATFVSLVVTATVQASVNPAILGRVLSVVLLASAVMAPLSYLFAGLASAVTPVVLFGTAGTAVMAATAYAARDAALRNVD
jgi:hypothetical protein